MTVQNETTIKFAICLSYYVLGGMATTNIQRLLKGSTLSVAASKCFCPVCGHQIRLIDQLPIFSYLFCSGRCRSCKTKIPKDTLILEIIILAGMSLAAFLFEFSPFGVLVSFLYFEIIKIGFILRFGKRENNFVKQYIISILLNIVPFLLIEFMALLKLYI